MKEKKGDFPKVKMSAWPAAGITSLVSGTQRLGKMAALRGRLFPPVPGPTSHLGNVEAECGHCLLGEALFCHLSE